MNKNFEFLKTNFPEYFKNKTISDGFVSKIFTFVDERQVRFRGEVMTLSGSALIVIEEMGYDWGQVRGASFWCYKDKTLASLYEEI